jgi:hypothetical protein
MIVICLEINKYRCLPIINEPAWQDISRFISYGMATGELVEHAPFLFAQIALDQGRPGIVGAGLNVWLNEDIQEGKNPTISLIFRANMVVESR